MSTEVAVIGAGAIGLSLAYELARRGHRVTVIERDEIPTSAAPNARRWDLPRSASTWAASGILPPANVETATDPIDRLRGLSHRLFPALASRLRDETGIDCQLRRCGALYLSDSVGETAAMVGMVQYWRELAIECQEITLEELARRQPALRHWGETVSGAKAWWVPDEYTLCTPMYMAALAAGCEREGVRLLDRTTVTGIDDLGGAVRLHLSHSGSSDNGTAAHDGREAPDELNVPRVALCAGVWSGRIAQSMRLSQSLVPVRGQILLLHTEQPLVTSVINLGNRYLVPRENGDLLVGSCEEEVGMQHGTTPGKLQQLRRFAYDMCPALRSAREVSAWSGLRPLTFDGFPMCGKLPGSETLFVATGHFRSGIHLSPGTAVCMADLMTGQIPPIAMDDFRVGKQQQPFDKTTIDG